MGYLAVKGAEEAILAAGSRAGPTGGGRAVTAVAEPLPLVVDEIQAEAGVYEPRLAAIAFTQARGDLAEAVFLLRGYRSTLPRRAPARAATADLLSERRISSAFRNVPGGQILGATNDYGLRLLDPELGTRDDAVPDPAAGGGGTLPKVLDHLRAEGLVAPPTRAGPADDITRRALRFPASRSAR